MLPVLFYGPFDLLQVALLPGPEFPRMLDSLLQPCDLRAEAIKTSLDAVQRLALVGMRFARSLDLGLDLPLPGDGFLEAGFTFADRCALLAFLGLEFAEAEGQQLGLELALLLLELFVALGRPGLSLQVLDLLLDLLAQIVQPAQVVLGVADTVLGLPAPVLVL